MEENSTVAVKMLDDNLAILMHWQQDIQPKDVYAAYRRITELLDNAPSPQYVVVDLTENPRFPLHETIKGALFGPYTHRNLVQWLVVGKHAVGQTIARVLASTTGKQLVKWFDTMDEALAYLQQAKA
jgi:hypothetical protein